MTSLARMVCRYRAGRRRDTYDALGNLIGETDALGNATAFAYTAESLLEMVTYANGATQSLTYDLAGNVTAETDAEGNTKAVPVRQGEPSHRRH